MKHATVAGLCLGAIAWACAITLVACNDPFGGATPFIEGSIIARPSAQIMVVEVNRPSDDCLRTLDVGLQPDVQGFEGGSRKDTSALKVGRRVSVYGALGPQKSCPPPAGAWGVLLR